MAKEEKPMIELERTYNVPLRRVFIRAPKWKRTRRASRALREFLVKHMKSDNVKIGKYLNLEIWKHGGKNPPHHVKVVATKDSEGLVKAELEGAPKAVVKAEKPKKDSKKEAKPKSSEEPKKEEKKPEPKAEENIGEKVPTEEKKAPEPKDDVKEVEALAKQVLKKGSTK